MWFSTAACPRRRAMLCLHTLLSRTWMSQEESLMNNNIEQKENAIWIKSSKRTLFFFLPLNVFFVSTARALTHTLNVFASPVPQCFYGLLCVCVCVLVCLSAFHDCLVWVALSLVQFLGVKTDQKGLAWLLPLNTHTYTHTHTDWRLGARALGGWRLMKGSDWRERLPSVRQ